MKKVHLVICDLFLPAEFAAAACAGLHVPVLEKMLTRGASAGPVRAEGGTSLEGHLCELFGVPDHPVAAVSAAFDGLGNGCWLRADPVHLRLQRDQLVLLPDLDIDAGEAAQLCAALNGHFAGQGMEFFVPHPQRWYVRTDRMTETETLPLSQVAGRDVRGLLPTGAEAAHWHRLLNEVQMLLHSHPVNENRAARGDLPVNSLWFWGGGHTTNALPQKTYGCVSSDEVLAEMFAAGAGVPFSGWAGQWSSHVALAVSQGKGESISVGAQLLVWTGLRSALRRGDLDAWRTALQEFETGYAQPLWRALRGGEISRLQVDILGGDGLRQLLLSRGDTWAFWRRTVPFAEYAMV